MMNKRPSRRRHKTVKKPNNFKIFFKSNFLNIVGVLFLGSGLFYLIDFYSVFLYNFILEHLVGGGLEKQGGGSATTLDYLFELLLYFSPAIVGWIACIVFFEKIKKWVLPIAIVLIFHLLYFHFKIGLYCDTIRVYIYPNFYVAALISLIITSLLSVIYFQSKKTWFFFFILFQFYGSLFVLKLQFSNYYIISCSFIFSLIFYWVGSRFKSVSAIFINFVFASLFFIYFFIKKLIFESILEFIDFFFVFSLLFFVVFLMMSLSKSFYGKKGYFLAFSSLNSLFYFIANALVISKYYDSIYLIFPILTLIVFQLIAIFIVRKNNLRIWIFPMEMIIALLLAGLFSVILNQNGVALIFGFLSLVLIKYALIEKNKWFVKLSFVSVMLMTLYSLFLLSGLLIPLLSLKLEHVESVFIKNLLNIFGVVLSLFLVKKQVPNLSDLVSKKEFNTKKHLEFINGFLLIAIFLLFEGLIFILFHALTQTFLFSSLIFILMGSLFFFIVDKKMTDLNSTKVFLGMIVFFVLLFPITEYFDFPISKSIYLLSSNFSYPRMVLHYIALFLFFAIAIQTVKKMYQINAKNSIFLCLIDIFFSMILVLIVCKEYDFMTLLFNLANSKSFSILDFNLLLEYNQILPYSILILMVSLSILIYGIIRQNRFLKAISIVFAGLLFVYTFLLADDDEIYQNFRVLLFFVLGIMFILFSWTEKQLKKTKKSNKISHDKPA